MSAIMASIKNDTNLFLPMCQMETKYCGIAIIVAVIAAPLHNCGLMFFDERGPNVKFLIPLVIQAILLWISMFGLVSMLARGYAFIHMCIVLCWNLKFRGEA